MYLFVISWNKYIYYKALHRIALPHFKLQASRLQLQSVSHASRPMQAGRRGVPHAAARRPARIGAGGRRHPGTAPARAG